MNKKITKELFNKLEEKYASLWPWPENSDFNQDPFKRLIITVLSQNTNDLNTARAYKGLSKKFDVNPFTLQNASINEIKESIKHGGLYNIKAKRIKEISKAVLDKFDGDISFLLKLPKKEAKEKLKELPGVGDKTADVLLTTTYGYKEVIPVDTHMNRIAKRFGLVSKNEGYDKIQSALLSFVPPMFREKGFGYLWLFAKYTCKSQNPECGNCLLSNLCQYVKGGIENE